MTVFLVVFAVVTALALLGVLWLRSVLREAKDSPEYQQEMAHLKAGWAAEENLIEQADWFGQTGLDEDIERELPKYLRREFGENVLDADAVKAKDLVYVGCFSEGNAKVHYWRVPTSDGEPTFAYVEDEGDGNTCTGWGNREPPIR